MADHDKYIEELLRYLSFSLETEERWEKAVRALVAERDALKQRVAVLESQEFTLPTDPFRDPDRDLRERLLESALQGSGCRLGIMEESDAEELGRQAAWIVNGALAAMRKGESNGQ